MSKLGILFIAGVVLFGVPVLFLFSDTSNIVNFYLVIPAGVGLFLIILAVHYGTRQFDTYMNK